MTEQEARPAPEVHVTDIACLKIHRSVFRRYGASHSRMRKLTTTFVWQPPG